MGGALTFIAQAQVFLYKKGKTCWGCSVMLKGSEGVQWAWKYLDFELL